MGSHPDALEVVAYDIVGIVSIELDREEGSLSGQIHRFLEAAAALSDVAVITQPFGQEKYCSSHVALIEATAKKPLWCTFGPHEKDREAHVARLLPPTELSMTDSISLLIPQLVRERLSKPLEALLSKARHLFQGVPADALAGLVLGVEYQDSEPTAKLPAPGAEMAYWAQGRYFESLREVFDSVERIAERRGFPLAFGLKVERFERVEGQDGNHLCQPIWHPSYKKGKAGGFVAFRLGNHVSMGALDRALTALTDDFDLLETTAGAEKTDKPWAQREPKWSTSHSSVLRQVASLHLRHDLGYEEFFSSIATPLAEAERKYWAALGRENPGPRAVFCAPIAHGDRCDAAWYLVLPADKCKEPRMVRDLLGLHYEIRDVFAVLVEDRLIAELAREIASSGEDDQFTTLARCEALTKMFLGRSSPSPIAASAADETLGKRLDSHDAAAAALEMLSGPTARRESLHKRLERRPDLMRRVTALSVRPDNELTNRLVGAIYHNIERRLTRDEAARGHAYLEIERDVRRMTRLAADLQATARLVSKHVFPEILPEISRALVLSALFDDASQGDIKIEQQNFSPAHQIFEPETENGVVKPAAERNLRFAAHYLFDCSSSTCEQNHLADQTIEPEWVGPLPWKAAGQFAFYPCTYLKNVCFRGEDAPRAVTLDLCHFLFVRYGRTPTAALEKNEVAFFEPKAGLETFKRMVSAAVRIFFVHLERRPAVRLERNTTQLAVELRGTFDMADLAQKVASEAAGGASSNRPRFRGAIFDALGRPSSLSRSTGSGSEKLMADNGASCEIQASALWITWPGQWTIERRA